MKTYAIALAGWLLLVGGVRAGIPDNIGLAGDNEATIYVVRPAALSYAVRTAQLDVDDAEVVALKYKSCSVFKVPAGGHSLSEKWRWSIVAPPVPDFSRVTVQADWKAGARYYYMLWSDARMVGPAVGLDWGLSEIDAAKASDYLSTCRYTEPQGAPFKLNAPMSQATDAAK